MRKIANVNTGSVKDLNVRALFDEIFRASNENDTIDIAQAFSISGSFTATRTLNVSSPTLANVVAVVATLISDLQRGGTNRNT